MSVLQKKKKKESTGDPKSPIIPCFYIAMCKRVNGIEGKERKQVRIRYVLWTWMMEKKGQSHFYIVTVGHYNII
jgi:hypothetical protein